MQHDGLTLTDQNRSIPLYSVRDKLQCIRYLLSLIEQYIYSQAMVQSMVKAFLHGPSIIELFIMLLKKINDVQQVLKQVDFRSVYN